MNVATVMDELGAAVDMIEGLRVLPWWADKFVPPAAVVTWSSGDLAATYGRGMDRHEFLVTVAVSKVSARTAPADLAAYVDGGNAADIKNAIEGHGTSAWDSAHVTSVDAVPVITTAGTEYLAAQFTCDVVGSGS